MWTRLCIGPRSIPRAPSSVEVSVMSITSLDPAPAVGVLTISDRSSAGVREDVSGPRIIEWCKAREYRVEEYSIVPDETSAIVSLLTQWARL